jgi:two-component system response regulator DegU
MFKTLAERRVLTPRESQIVNLVSQGQVNKQIGYLLGISEQSVKNTVSCILLKTECANRTHLAVKWVRNEIAN